MRRRKMNGQTENKGPIVPGLDEALAVIQKAVEELKSGPDRASAGEEDTLLTVKEVARVLSVSEYWVYDNAHKLPFTRKLGPKMLRFSRNGLQKYMETRRC
jgi:excisionase family DNA binding protein